MASARAGVIEIGNIKQAGNVVGTLSHSRSSSKKGVGSTRKAPAAQEPEKRSIFLSKKLISWKLLQNRGCKSVFELENLTDMIVDGVL